MSRHMWYRNIIVYCPQHIEVAGDGVLKQVESRNCQNTFQVDFCLCRWLPSVILVWCDHSYCIQWRLVSSSRLESDKPRTLRSFSHSDLPMLSLSVSCSSFSRISSAVSYCISLMPSTSSLPPISNLMRLLLLQMRFSIVSKNRSLLFSGNFLRISSGSSE